MSSSQTLNITVGNDTITSTVGTDTINITVGTNSITINSSLNPTSYIDEDDTFRLDGASGDSYFKYNSTTSKVELWVDGVKKAAWG